MIMLLNKQRGFTLIEAVMAQVVLIISALAIFSSFIMGSRFNAESEDRTVAANIAQHKMEEIMNARFRYIVVEYPPGQTRFDSEPQEEPYWGVNSSGGWLPVLPEGRYEIGYPDGVDADPLRVKVKVMWQSHMGAESYLDIDTRVAMTPGRFR